jgi:hypothetical protein
VLFELEKGTQRNTRELSSAELIIELLQTEGSTNERVGYGTTELRNLIQSKELRAEKIK